MSFQHRKLWKGLRVNCISAGLVASHYKCLVESQEDYEFDGHEFCQRSFILEFIFGQAVENE